MTGVEANFDGIVGPTHNYSGLSFGNLASLGSGGSVANPREAALQGLEKMKFLADLGVPQGVLPPHDRPAVDILRQRGFEGSDAAILRDAARDPRLLSEVSSASAMWAANAATFSPSADTSDGLAHFTAANLVGNRHRAIEASQTSKILRTIFPGDAFVHHEPLPDDLGDEGAANHTRLAPAHDEPGVEVFVFGSGGSVGPTRYPGRQHAAASRRIAEQHGLTRWVGVQQHPEAIDRGVFHNDVIAVGDLMTLLLHEEAWLDQPAALATLGELVAGLEILEVPSSVVPLADAVESYLFNSQLITVGGRQILVAPHEVTEVASVAAFLPTLVDGPGPIDEIVTFDLRQSMRNGGGPACLRLRVALTDAERASVKPTIWLTDSTYEALRGWVERHYRHELAAADLADPSLLDESRRALDELTTLLDLGSVYDFQR